MPYLGLKNGEPIKPIEAHPDAIVECPSCGREMGVRQSYYKSDGFVPSHFFHYSNPEGCSGESAVHYRMKSIAAEHLEELFPTAEVGFEVNIGERIADVCVTFDQPIKPYGKGLIVEAQHKNKDKNIGQVTEEYFEDGWSVYWAYLSDFESDELEIEEDRLWTLWPEKLPDRSGLDGYSECVQDLMREDHDSAIPSIEAVVPTAYFRDFALEILSPTQVTAPSWTVHKRCWLKDRGSRISWLNLLEAPNRRRYMEVWVQDTDENWHDHTALPMTQRGVSSLQDFLRQVADIDEGQAKPSGTWWTLATSTLPGYEGSGVLRLSGAPNGDIVFRVERVGREGNRYSIQTAWDSEMTEAISEFLSTLSSLSW